MSKLTLKQAAFVDAYMGVARGNATEAARIAGYKGNDNTLRVVGGENLLKPAIASAIDERRQQVASSRIMTIEQMQEMLTQIAANNADADPQVAINAVKELGKMQGAYIDRQLVEHSGTLQTVFVVPSNGREGCDGGDT